MFFVTYLRRELRRRMRQAIFVALGLGVGVGLVVTVSAASAGVAGAESEVLGTLYGVGTNVTVTGAKRAGMRAVLIPHSEVPPHDGVVPDAVISRLSELPAHLDSW
jgi:ABC-type lipoprotein release transport system permease subunit